MTRGKDGKFQRQERGRAHLGKDGKRGRSRSRTPENRNITMAQRKKKLAEIKAKTRCRDCGGKGHWAGDPACPKKKSNVASVAFPADGEDFTSLSESEMDRHIAELRAERKKKSKDKDKEVKDGRRKKTN